MQVGAVVSYRGKEWVVLPSYDASLLRLRPLIGTDEDVIEVHAKLRELVSTRLKWEQMTPAEFPLPSVDDVSDTPAVYLLWHAARLLLREGAAPLRCLGRISIRPRLYQLVPLMMALRLHPVRLFIADDVGVGKTIEALLIARELLDRGEIRRLCVLCPPYLCDQWQREMSEKFGMEAVVFRSGTVSRLERDAPAGQSVYEYYPIQVASIDFVKLERNRAQFVQFCPEMVIVDEVHGATEPHGGGQQERHALLRQLAEHPQRHLIFLTATPHSGIRDDFQSLLSLLRAEFGEWNLSELDERQRQELARHYVQRTRGDIQQYWKEAHSFPQRQAEEITYALDEASEKLFEGTYRLCAELLSQSKSLGAHQQRVHYWGVLALLRCVMSSPKAALVALERRSGLPQEGPGAAAHEPGSALLTGADDEAAAETDEFAPFVLERDTGRWEDETPIPAMEAAEADWSERQRRYLRSLVKLAQSASGLANDAKLQAAVQKTQQLLDEGFAPILWCRYVATAEYLAEHLRQALPQEVQVVCITGRLGDEERRLKIEEIDGQRPRVLVATDCLSEGINLQEKFTAVLHYDLPWNPNRLEQREGRVDRYGQTAAVVRTVLLYGRNNPVDGAVLEVLLRKAREIHRTLGTHVPVPHQSEQVWKAVLHRLFLCPGSPASSQLRLLLDTPDIRKLHEDWERDVRAERLSRSRFAQRAIKLEEVQDELQQTDDVLGDPEAVREFVVQACQRLQVPLECVRRAPAPVYRLALGEAELVHLPEPLRFLVKSRVPSRRGSASTFWYISFASPTPPEAEYVGRNHPWVTALARYLFEDALSRHGQATAARAGALRTGKVARVTVLWLVRLRFQLERLGSPPMFVEEVRIWGTQGLVPPLTWLEESAARSLLAQAQAEVNMPLAEKRDLVQSALDLWPQLDRDVLVHMQQRAEALRHTHRRIRRFLGERQKELEVRPLRPVDVIGLLVLQPRVSS
ncbi:MAG: helicase-related protein [Gemmatales bacterium]|nr:DEAD/DEAH box helicase [Gemmatales bacterium]MCS7159778.1 DEAD/DEAH box helicase [Gemmatales bacterium]MDW8174976.1 helicase-related protein [Gemmatales bacterium]MDW8221369.1 helicase-related protein [Gemmatales bacterium]